MILWIHPVLQTLAVLLSLYVLYLGVTRFRFTHLGHKGILFQWNRHVAQGIAVMVTWLLAFAIGLGAAWKAWSVVGITETHYLVALGMLPLIGFGLGSGFVMDKVKTRRKMLPLVHGIVNTLLVALALWQFATGIIVLRDMVLA